MDVCISPPPTVTRTFTSQDGGVSFTAQCIGGRNWSLGKLYNQDALAHDQEFADDLAQVLGDVDAKQVFAPTPTAFNAKIVRQNALSSMIRAGVPGLWEVPIYRNKEMPADGTHLDAPGDVGMISAGGCPTIVVTHGTTMLFAHAGRDSVLDRTWIKTGHAMRDHESVAHAALAWLKEYDPSMRLNGVEVQVLWSIEADSFGHPLTTYLPNGERNVHLDWNNKALEYVQNRYGHEAAYKKDNAMCLDLPAILREQFAQEDVPAANIHLDDSKLPAGFSTTRGEQNNDRYLVAIGRQ